MASAPSNPRVYMDIQVGNQPPSRVQFELYENVVPKTVSNFRALCTGEKGKGRSGRNLHFLNS